VSIDLDKLARIREQLDGLRDAAEATFARYRERAVSAEQHRRASVQGARGYAHLTTEQLLGVPPKDATAAGVDLAAVRAAERDLRMARELRADHDRQRAAFRGLNTLVPRLEEHAAQQGAPSMGSALPRMV
jgi:hypothetical protein